MKKDHYKTLGVSKKADKKAIKRAYRSRVKDAHPDKQGDQEQFLQIQLAYDVLSDDERRARYDDSGDDSTPRDESEPLSLFLREFMGALEENPQSNGLRLAQERLSSAKDSIEQQLHAARERLQLMSKQAKSYRTAGESNLLAEAIERTLKSLRATISECDRRLRVIEKAKAIADEYVYIGEDLREQRAAIDPIAEMFNAMKNSGFKAW